MIVMPPTFDDPNDKVGEHILENLYTTRNIVGVDFTEVYKDGGLAHCVTQQQPAVRES
jgi:agmatine deiminase